MRGHHLLQVLQIEDYLLQTKIRTNISFTRDGSVQITPLVSRSGPPIFFKSLPPSTDVVLDSYARVAP